MSKSTNYPAFKDPGILKKLLSIGAWSGAPFQSVESLIGFSLDALNFFSTLIKKAETSSAH